LGNVLAVVSDELSPFGGVGGGEANVVSATDYYAFGQEMPGRTFASDDYRYGFNGKENDREWGESLIQDYGMRLYNPALCRFLSVDPLTKGYPMLTPYQFASNCPIACIDLDGLEGDPSPDASDAFSGLSDDEVQAKLNKSGMVLQSPIVRDTKPSMLQSFVGGFKRGFVRGAVGGFLIGAGLTILSGPAAATIGGALIVIAVISVGQEIKALITGRNEDGKKMNDNQWYNRLGGLLGETLGAVGGAKAGNKVGGAIVEAFPSLKRTPGGGMAEDPLQKESPASGKSGDGGCFTTETPIKTAIGFVTIGFIATSIQAGAANYYVLAYEPPKDTISYITEADKEAITPDTWQWVHLKVNRTNGQHSEVSLLRPKHWVNEHNIVAAGNSMFLDLPEVGITGTAFVTGFSPTDIDTRATDSLTVPYETYTYRPVTGVFVHHVSETCRLAFDKDTVNVVNATLNHRFYSADRHTWIPAAELCIGEHVLSPNGVVQLTRYTYTPQPTKVYNLEVYRTHTYLVGTMEAVVHNPGPCWPWKKTELSVKELTANGGNCEKWAGQIQEKIGGDIIHIQDTYGAPRIGEVYTKSGKPITGDWAEHFAVRKEDMIYDRITGPEGLHIEDYKQLFQYGEYLNFDNVVKK
jgi:RHS repeat-associated protein